MVYVTGDIHGDIRRFRERKLRRLKKDDFLIICGDFGFIWNESESEKKSLAWLSKRRYTILFVDGTHENFDLLAKYPEEEWHGGKARKIAGNIFHLMRGQVFTISGDTYFTFGGGISDDKHIRRDQKMWWKEELPTLEEMKTGVETLDNHNRAVTYVITHEPAGKIKSMIAASDNSISSLEIFFNELMKQVRYKCWYSGGLHVDKKIISRHQCLYRDVLPVDPIAK